MKLTREQQIKVEENLGLVYKVLGDKLKGQSAVGSYTREDLFQVGCIGLCKAAATDKGGTFSTYAYRLIWHEICDVLVKSNKQRNAEIFDEYERNIPDENTVEHRAEINFDVVRALVSAKAEASPHVVKSIDAMLLMVKGYTCREIDERMGASDNLVSAYMSKARKYLKEPTGVNPDDDIRGVKSKQGIGENLAPCFFLFGEKLCEENGKLFYRCLLC